MDIRQSLKELSIPAGAIDTPNCNDTGFSITDLSIPAGAIDTEDDALYDLRTITFQYPQVRLIPYIRALFDWIAQLSIPAGAIDTGKPSADTLMDIAFNTRRCD